VETDAPRQRRRLPDYDGYPEAAKSCCPAELPKSNISYLLFRLISKDTLNRKARLAKVDTGTELPSFSKGYIVQSGCSFGAQDGIRSDQMSSQSSVGADYDAIVVGAGFAGMYMLHRLRSLGLSVRVYEAGGGVGGTWYWNRYPGARCDGESIYYSYQFDKDLQQEWTWTERYATQPEILSYANHVADRFDLLCDIEFNTRVVTSKFDDATATWTIETDGGDKVVSRFLILAVGCLSSVNNPRIDGIQRFGGEVYHTGEWPHEEVDFAGLNVGVIGTGSSAVQAIPKIAEQAKHLHVFQRTANYVVPAQNRPLEPDEVRWTKANYDELRAGARLTPTGNPFDINDKSALEVSPEERAREYEKRWQEGGLALFGTFNDLLLDENANHTAAEFVREKIRKIVNDPKLAELLCPDDVILCKRLCVDTGYFETYNRPNVSLVDVSRTPIDQLTPGGLTVGGKDYELDAIVFATGFDAITGSILKIEICGANGVSLRDQWKNGPHTYLGLAVADFPNLFIITAPGSPSVLTNMIATIEQHVEWIADCLDHMRERDFSQIAALREAQDGWVEHCNEAADRTLKVSCNSWYVGANVPGKPRFFMPYIGGMPAYRDKCDDVAAKNYEGFRFA
jgi:cation diffusion facilitator CzcD-associated flavoprotein CzcO